MRIHKQIFFLLLMIIITSPLFCQTSIGIRSGLLKSYPVKYLSNPHFSGDIIFNNSLIQTAYFKIRQNKLFLGINLNYKNYNADYDVYYQSSGSHHSSGKNINYKYGYLNIYFYPEISFGKKFRFYINAGINCSLLINSHRQGIVCTYSSSNNEYKESVVFGSAHEDLWKLYAGIQAGIGINYNIANNWYIVIDKSLSYGLMNVINDYIMRSMDIMTSVGIEYKFN